MADAKMLCALTFLKIVFVFHAIDARQRHFGRRAHELEISVFKQNLIQLLHEELGTKTASHFSQKAEERMRSEYAARVNDHATEEKGILQTEVSEGASTKLQTFEAYEIPLLSENEGTVGPTVGLNFDMTSSNLIPSSIVNAHLKVYKIFNQSCCLGNEINRNHKARLLLYQIIKNADGSLRSKMADSKLVSLSSGWEIFHIQKLVLNWVRDPESNEGLEVHCRGTNIICQALQFVSPDSSLKKTQTHHMPKLEVVSRRLHDHVIEKRATTPDMCQDRRCCRQSVTINVQEVGLENIIEPRELTAYYCSGACPYGYKVMNRYAQVKSGLNLHNHRSALSLCCTPSKFKNLTVLHTTGNGRFTLSEIDNLLVEECACG